MDASGQCLDRLARSVRKLIEPTPPGGRLVFQIFGALAEFEPEIVHPRTLAGPRAAQARPEGDQGGEGDARRLRPDLR